MTNTLDPGYRDAAVRRAAAADADRGGARRRRITAATALLAVGLLLTLAAVQTRRAAPAAARTRAALVAEVQRQTGSVDGLERTERSLDAQVSGLRARALSSAGGTAAARRLAQLQAATGAVAMTGPGVEVTLDDAHATPAPLATGQGSSPEAGRVYDRDLQQVVNALWAVGAEAIAINGQRLTVLSSIRQAGDAILVDYRPLVAPYVVVAIGDPDRLEPDFVGGATAARFRTYAAAYGLRFSVRSVSQAQVPAATGLVLHAARPAAGRTAPSSSPKGTP